MISFLYRHRKSDYIILTGLTSLLFYQLVKFTPAQVVCIIHGHEILMTKGVKNWMVRHAIKGSKLVIAVSNFSRRKLIENGVSRKVFVVPNGVNIKSSLPSHTPNTDKLILVTVGSLSRRKGQHNVVAALPSLLKRFDKIEYHMVGIPINRAELEKLAEKLNVTDHVFFHGALNDEDKNRILEQANLFMMLSENQPDGDVEGFGIAILEANMVGLPAIGSLGTGVEQAISDGVNGFLVDSNDSLAIVEKIEIILKRYPEFSNGAINWAHQHDWKLIGKKYLDLIFIGE